MIAAVQHDTRARGDYALLKTVGIRTARDAVRWHLMDKGGGEYDFSSFAPMLDAALAEGIQVIWDLCHYGFPDGLNLLKPEFVDRFGKFCKAVATFVRDRTDEVPYYSPVNEINFFCWGASRDLMYPYAFGRDNEIKLQLIRAAIAGTEAVWSVDPRARISWPEPSINILPPIDRPDLRNEAEALRMAQYEAWDMISGRLRPELGGKPEYLDIPGSNFYADNQWEIQGHGHLQWHEVPRDPRWRPYSEMLKELWERYRRPVYVAETSHVGVGRARWIRELSEQTAVALKAGVPVHGICLYPALDRFDWQDPTHWHNSGLWDFADGPAGLFDRVLNPDYAEALSDSEALLAQFVPEQVVIRT